MEFSVQEFIVAQIISKLKVDGSVKWPAILQFIAWYLLFVSVFVS